jgi:hypothetical protein
LLDVEVPGEVLDIVDRHELVEPQREQRQRQPRCDQRFDLAADRAFVLAEARVDEHRGVALRQEVAVRYRKAACTCGIGADSAVERIRMLQGVELSFGERGDAARYAVHFANFAPPMLSQCGHDN